MGTIVMLNCGDDAFILFSRVLSDSCRNSAVVAPRDPETHCQLSGVYTCPIFGNHNPRIHLQIWKRVSGVVTRLLNSALMRTCIDGAAQVLDSVHKRILKLLNRFTPAHGSTELIKLYRRKSKLIQEGSCIKTAPSRWSSRLCRHGAVCRIL